MDESKQMKKSKTIWNLLKNRGLMTEEIDRINFHMNLLNCNVDYLTSHIPELHDKGEDEVLAYVMEAFKKCDQSNPEYDYNMDEQMTRIGLKTNMFPGPHKNHNIWNNGMFADDGFGFGTELTSMYDDYIDAENDRHCKK